MVFTNLEVVVPNKGWGSQTHPLIHPWQIMEGGGGDALGLDLPTLTQTPRRPENTGYPRSQNTGEPRSQNTGEPRTKNTGGLEKYFLFRAAWPQPLLRCLGFTKSGSATTGPRRQNRRRILVLFTSCSPTRAAQ